MTAAKVRQEAKAGIRQAAYLLGETLPAAMRPTRDAHRLTVALVWQGTVVELRDVPRDRPFTVGPRGATLQVVHELVGGRPIPLFRPANGAVEVLLPDAIEGAVRRDGRELRGADLVQAGEARAIDVPCRGAVFAMGLEDRIALKFGELTLVARHVRPEAMPVRKWHDGLDPQFLSTLTIGLFAAVLLTRFMAMADVRSSDPGDGLKVANQYVQHIVRVAPPPPPVKKPESAKAAEKSAGEKGKAGRPDAVKKETAMSKPGGGPDKKAHDQQVVNDTVLLKLLADSGGPLKDVLKPGGIAGLNLQIGTAVASNDFTDQFGPGGTSRDGRGDGGGGHGPYRIGSIGDKPGTALKDGKGLALDGGHHKSSAPPDRIVLSEGYDKEVIARIVRRHWNEIRYCYEQALSRNPNLAGKVAVHFTIGPVGDLTEVTAGDVTLDSSDAVACMLKNVGRWQFPAPKGGGTVEVTYPFLFQAD